MIEVCLPSSMMTVRLVKIPVLTLRQSSSLPPHMILGVGLGTILGNVPVYAYGIEADTYEEAEALAKQMFRRDYNADIERALRNREEDNGNYFT